MPNITVLNTSANLSSKTLLAAENANTVTGLLTFDRDPSAPFAVSASSAVVTNLDADKVDGQHAPTGTIVGTSDSQTLTNKTIALGSNTVSGTTAQFNSALSDGDFATIAGSETLTNKTLTSPTINAATLSGTLAGTPTFSGVFTNSAFGTHSFSAGGTGEQILSVRNTSAGTGNAGTLYLGNDSSAFAGRLSVFASNYTTGTYDVQAGVALQAAGAGGISIAATNASGALRFYAGGTTQRFSISTDGNWLKGTSIMHSVGTPTIASGGGTGPSIVGTDYGFRVTIGTTPGATDIVINYGNTWTNAPVATANYHEGSNPNRMAVTTSTTQATLKITESANWTAGATINVLSAGY